MEIFFLSDRVCARSRTRSTTRYDACCWLAFLLPKSRDFGRCDSGGKVFVLGVEAVSAQGLVDRRVLTTDVVAGLGLATCERSAFSQTASLLAEWRREVS